MISSSRLILRGSPLCGENPQPFFREPDFSVSGGPAFPEDKYPTFGRETGFRLLPYTMQDRYGREPVELEFPAVVMENDFLKAEFIPALGGRLWSLFDKTRKRDILYRNPVFRPANLAIRDAWFSGGIEWNIGRFGHGAHTCSPVFAGVFEAGGTDVLRLWEFERQTRLFWRIEFTLSEDSQALFAYTRIENPGNEAKPLYWWTNAAVPQTPRARVFSASGEVIFIVPGTGKVKTMDLGRLPDLPVLPGRDASFPALSDYSNEYFFQNDRVCDEQNPPWESVVYEDGYAYGEMSTLPLLYRKMFCWGNGRGGRRWQDFLSLPGEEYLEVQAGLAPTQLHTADIPEGGTIDWVQAFTSFQAEPETALQRDYSAASAHIAACLARRLHSAALGAALEQARSRAGREAEILCAGSGWGALERRMRGIPRGLSFPDDSIGGAEAPWAELAESGSLPLLPPDSPPGSFAIDKNWETLLAASPARKGDWLRPYHLGIIAFERGDSAGARAWWEQSLEAAENPWACRNLALAAKREGNIQAALDYYKRALALPGGGDISFVEEYIPLLPEAGKEDEAAAELDRLISGTASLERFSIPLLETAARLAMKRGDDALLDTIFSLEPAHIREGNTALVDLWLEREKKRGNSPGVPPREIDFRMYTR